MNKFLIQIKRLSGYCLGFILFYAPFALFQKTIIYLFGFTKENPTIHNLCFRIPIEHFLSGNFFTMSGVSFIGTILLLSIAFFWGPWFCGFFCPAGAFPEYLSKLIPTRFKVNWSNHIPITPIKYGFLFGFLISPFTGNLLACSYCNFFVFDLLFNFIFLGYTVAFSSSLLLTMLFWLFIFGIFTQGGRGFCLFFCPVGSMQNLIHYLGSKTPFSWQLKIINSNCSKCNKCINICPMTALKIDDNEITINKHICILCKQCIDICPENNFEYNRNKRKGKINE